MTITIELVLYAIAVVLLILAGFGVATNRNWGLGWWGLAIAIFTFGVLPAF
jgi:hypothetical protein